MFIPANADKDEVYGKDLDESIHFLRSYLHKHDIVAARLFSHLLMHYDYETTLANIQAKRSIEVYKKYSSPKGFITKNGVSVYWHNGKLHLNGKEII